MTWQFTLTGLLIGALVGLTGMGGGSLMTPALVFLFGFDPVTAIGTDVLHGAIFKSVGGLRHHRLGTVQARLSGWMLAGSAPASLGGVALATWLHRRYGGGLDSVEGIVLGAVLLAGGLGMLLKALVRFRSHPEEFVLRRRDRLAAVAIGLLGGFLVGLTSVGSGVFFGLTLLVVFPLRAHKVVGTDIVHAAALLWVAGIGHLVAGNVDLHTLAWLLLGSIPGVLAGSQLTLAVGDRPLRLLLALVLLVSGARLALPGGIAWIAVAAVCVVLVALVAVRLARAPVAVEARVAE
ncbi:MAG TPA: sulfite exporter TauE/SafE family protein [Gaiellaceae bacterium]|nr:sulfite exporter TauE/SafE family protein [Gaiellaceae bacterium]